MATKVRESMRLVAQPMALITTPVDSTDLKQPLLGLVASSFNVVSLAAPEGPIVSFNLKLPSRTFAAISACGQFEVSFPWSSELCRTFLSPPPTKSQDHKDNQNKAIAGDTHNQHVTAASGNSKRSKKHPVGESRVAHESRRENLLRLHRTFAYRCEWLQEQSVAVADHIIMIGRVKEYVLGDTINPVDVRAEQLPINYRESTFLRLRTKDEDPRFFEYSVKEEVL